LQLQQQHAGMLPLLAAPGQGLLLLVVVGMLLLVVV
jgi:hypothetical protein